MALSDKSLSLAMVAGETSGDLLASRMLTGLAPRLPDAYIHGIGGQHMEAMGFHSDYPMDKLTVRGLFEIIPKYRELKGIQNQLRDQLIAENPAAFIGVDYPGFNLGLEEQLKAAGIPTIHFIGPQIWAWRGWRIKKIIRAVSHILVIFPFEQEIYETAKVPVTYVGHPLAEVIPMHPDMQAARETLGLNALQRVIAVLPGSRLSELKFMTPPFIDAIRLLKQREDSLQFVMPMAGEKQLNFFNTLVSQDVQQELNIKTILGHSHTSMAAADGVIVASGTASLEVALHKKPMVIAYKMMQASYMIMRHMNYLPWIGLPNILAKETLVPELIQQAATPEAIADAIWRQINDAPLLDKLTIRFTEMHHSLLRDTANESAKAVCQVIGQ